MGEANQITGPNADELRQFAVRISVAARVGQFCRSPVRGEFRLLTNSR